METFLFPIMRFYFLYSFALIGWVFGYVIANTPAQGINKHGFGKIFELVIRIDFIRFEISLI